VKQSKSTLVPIELTKEEYQKAGAKMKRKIK
jgi:hypothetical protein